MTLFEKAIASIDQYNQADPNTESSNGSSYPKEYIDSIRRSKWMEVIEPNASDALKIANRSQHIGRWEIPRKSYEPNRMGYLKWRSDLAKHHAQKTSEILERLGFDAATIDRVKAMNLKQNIKLDPEVQAIEDVLCLVFLENQIEDFAQNQDEEVMSNIIQKTWKKMSAKGKEAALTIKYSPETFSLLQKSLAL